MTDDKMLSWNTNSLLRHFLCRDVDDEMVISCKTIYIYYIIKIYRLCSKLSSGEFGLDIFNNNNDNILSYKSSG